MTDGTGGGAGRSELMTVGGSGPGSGARAVVLRSGFGRPLSPRGLGPAALIRSFRRRWATAIGLGIVLATAVGLAALMVIPPPQYTSRSYLKLAMVQPKVFYQTSEQGADFETFRKTQVDILRSAVVLNPALRAPEVAALATVKAQADPLEWLEREIRVDSPNNSEILVISMTCADESVPKPVVDAVVSAYMEKVVEDEHAQRVRRYEDLRKLLARRQAELQERRKAVRSLATAVGTGDPQAISLQHQIRLENIQLLRKELMNVQANIRHLKSYRETVEKKQQEARAEEARAEAEAGPPAEVAKAGPPPAAAAAAGPDPAVEARVEADPGAVDLRAAQDAAHGKYLNLRRLSRQRDDPPTVKAWNDYQAARDALAQYKARLRAAIAREDEARVAEAEANRPEPSPTVESLMAKYSDTIAIQEKQAAALTVEIEALRQEASKFGVQTMDLQAEQEEVVTADETVKQINKEVESLDVELNAPRRIKLMTMAEAPRKKDAIRQYMMCGGASFGAFALAVLLVSFVEMKAMRVGSAAEVEADLGLSLVGALPALPARGGWVSAAAGRRWQGLLVESIDATRTMLLHASRADATRAVLVTSASKGEGKTSLAAHLAASLARAGRRTLLVDCDLRRPTLHGLFDVALSPGLCELLRGEAPPDDAIHPTSTEDLSLLPAGLCDGSALQAIAQDGVREVLATLKARYDFIILDSAPVLPVVDTMLVAQQVDAVLFSVMKGVSRVPLVRSAHERLASLGIRMLGAVVSAADRRDTMPGDDYAPQSTDFA